MAIKKCKTETEQTMFLFMFENLTVHFYDFLSSNKSQSHVPYDIYWIIILMWFNSHITEQLHTWLKCHILWILCQNTENVEINCNKEEQPRIKIPLRIKIPKLALAKIYNKWLIFLKTSKETRIKAHILIL